MKTGSRVELVPTAKSKTMKTKAKLLTGAMLMAAIVQTFGQPMITKHPWDQAVEADANVTLRVTPRAPRPSRISGVKTPWTVLERPARL